MARIGELVASTHRPRCSAASAASGAASPSTPPATAPRCSSPPPTAWARSPTWPRPRAATTPSASTSWPCASTTSCAWARSRSSSSTTSPPGSSTPTRWNSSSPAWRPGAGRRAAPSSAARWRSTPVRSPPASSTSPGSPSESSSATRCWARSASSPATSSWACCRRGCVATGTPWRATSCSNGPGSRLDDPAWAGAPHTLADELLLPSVVYAPAVLAVLGALGPGDVHAAAHVTGGGLPGNLGRVVPDGADAVVDRGAWEEPRIFDEIRRLGDVDDGEMARVFNLGIGMVLVVDAAARPRRRRRARRGTVSRRRDGTCHRGDRTRPPRWGPPSRDGRPGAP